MFQFECCGINGTVDWTSTSWYNTNQPKLYPVSCCVQQTADKCSNDISASYSKVRQPNFLNIFYKFENGNYNADLTDWQVVVLWNHDDVASHIGFKCKWIVV